MGFFAIDGFLREGVCATVGTTMEVDTSIPVTVEEDDFLFGNILCTETYNTHDIYNIYTKTHIIHMDIQYTPIHI